MLRSGYMLRAATAFVILTAVLLLFLGLVVMIVGEDIGRWYVGLPIVIAVLVAEAAVVGNTFGPIVRTWVRGDG